MDDAALIDELRRVLLGRPEVIAAWLFGSRARGTARSDSDVDIGVLFATPPEPGAAGLPSDLEWALERAVRLPAQVVDLDRAGADLGKRVLRDGVRLVDRDSRRAAVWAERTRNRYWDMLPIWRLYRRLDPA